MAEVYWNGLLIQNITHTDYHIHSWKTSVTTQSQNTLTFKATGVSEGYGLALDNVNLHKIGTRDNLLVNGDFETPNVGNGWQIFQNPMGWIGNEVEIGYGLIYNKEWTSQVC